MKKYFLKVWKKILSLDKRILLIGSFLLLVVIATSIIFVFKKPGDPEIVFERKEEFTNHWFYQGVIYQRIKGLDNTFDFYAAKSDKPTPLIIYIHGGAWNKGDEDLLEILGTEKQLLSEGFSLVSIDYRLANKKFKYTKQIGDTEKAIDFMLKNSNYFNIDTQKIGFIGPSSGGYLSCMIMSDQKYLKTMKHPFKAAVLINPPTDLTFPTTERIEDSINLIVPKKSERKKASPITHISKNLPPILLVQGDLDKMVPKEETQKYYEALVNSDNKAELYLVTNAAHGITKVKNAGEMKPSLPEQQEKIINFFRDNLK